MSVSTDKIHVWAGIINANEVEDFDNYFELDYETEDMDDPEYKVCGFCKDVGMKWYDEDWIEVYCEVQTSDVTKFLDGLSISEETLMEIKDICINKGFDKINAMFCYLDVNSEFEIKEKDKLYNGLVYIGLFDTNFA